MVHNYLQSRAAAGRLPFLLLCEYRSSRAYQKRDQQNRAWIQRAYEIELRSQLVSNEAESSNSIFATLDDALSTLQTLATLFRQVPAKMRTRNASFKNIKIAIILKIFHKDVHQTKPREHSNVIACLFAKYSTIVPRQLQNLVRSRWASSLYYRRSTVLLYVVETYWNLRYLSTAKLDTFFLILVVLVFCQCIRADYTTTGKAWVSNIFAVEWIYHRCRLTEQRTVMVGGKELRVTGRRPKRFGRSYCR